MIGLIIGLIVPFLFIGIASQHKRISEKAFEEEPRLFLWESAIPVIKEKPLFGWGVSNAQEQFDTARTKYQTEGFRLTWMNKGMLDSHNQYLQTTMEFGVFGLLIALFLYIYPIFIVDKNRRSLSFFIIFLCMYQSVFDMFITGQFSLLFTLLTILILKTENGLTRRQTVRAI